MPMPDKTKNNLTGNKSGFTLIETLISLALFSVVALIATNIYVSVTYIQTRVASLQKIQEDIRYVMESMAQSVRLGEINYSCYVTEGVNLLIPTDKLALIDQTGVMNFYRKSGDSLQFCTGTETDCGQTGEGWQNITPAGVQLTDLKFVITPSADPFKVVDKKDCTSQNECTNDNAYKSYRCDVTDDLRCEYYSDNYKFQPKVKIILKTESSGERIAEKAAIQLQTIVSTRIPQFEVKNLNHD